MKGISGENPLAFTFGLLGNMISFIVFLAPIPTFIRVCRKKSTEGFQSFPYVIALFSATSWLYYASLKSGETLLVTVNSLGCLIETVYLGIYIYYAPKQARIFTVRMLFLVNCGGLCLIFLLSHFLKGPTRIHVLGWVSVSFAISVFAAPLSIMRVVIRTKSVEFMPFPLSFFLTISAVMWFLYGLFLKDYYVAFPNTLGLSFGVVQMILYAKYRNKKPTTVNEDQKLPEHKVDVVIPSSTTTDLVDECTIEITNPARMDRGDNQV